MNQRTFQILLADFRKQTRAQVIETMHAGGEAMPEYLAAAQIVLAEMDQRKLLSLGSKTLAWTIVAALAAIAGAAATLWPILRPATSAPALQTIAPKSELSASVAGSSTARPLLTPSSREIPSLKKEQAPK